MAGQTDQFLVEQTATTTPEAETDQALVEPAIAPIPPAEADQHLAEPVIRPDPQAQSDAIAAEATAYPIPPESLLQAVVEVIWREPPVKPEFAFRHNWAYRLTERLEWRTDVMRARDGTEGRIRLRPRPRRSMEIAVTEWDAGAISLDAWIVKNQGKEAYFPIWYAHGRIAAEAPAGATTLTLDRVPRMMEIMTQDLSIGAYGQGEALIIEADGDAQRVTITGINSTAGQITIARSLARAAARGSILVPVVTGVIASEVTARRHSGSATTTPIQVEMEDRLYQWTFINTLSLENMPVLTDAAQWTPEPDQGYQSRIEQIDNHIGTLHVTRVDDRPDRIISRRWLVAGEQEIDEMLALLDYLAGRYKPIWVPGEYTGMEILQDAAAGSDRLTVRRGRLPWAIDEPWLGILIRQPGGQPVAARVNRIETESESEATILLGDTLTADISAGAPATIIHLARMDHDRVEIAWHTDSIIEVAARFRTIKRCAAKAGAPAGF